VRLPHQCIRIRAFVVQQSHLRASSVPDVPLLLHRRSVHRLRHALRQGVLPREGRRSERRLRMRDRRSSHASRLRVARDSRDRRAPARRDHRHSVARLRMRPRRARPLRPQPWHRDLRARRRLCRRAHASGRRPSADTCGARCGCGVVRRDHCDRSGGAPRGPHARASADRDAPALRGLFFLTTGRGAIPGPS
jgi:hypothetical protein